MNETCQVFQRSQFRKEKCKLAMMRLLSTHPSRSACSFRTEPKVLHMPGKRSLTEHPNPTIFYFDFKHFVYVCLCAHTHTTYFWCLQRPEESAGVQAVVHHPGWVLRTELGSPVRTASTGNHWAISSVPFYFKKGSH